MSTLERSARILAADFVMVVMPWAMTNQPSLQAGLLCSILSQAGISAKTFYANLAFASAMNWNQYEEFCGFHNHAADWLFSETVFGVFKPNVPESEPADFFDFARLHGNDDSGLQKLQMLKAVVEACLQECLSSVAWENVRIVGFTTTMLQPLPALAFARLLKGKHPHLKILMGGAGCQEVMGRAMHRNFASSMEWSMGKLIGRSYLLCGPFLMGMRLSRFPVSIGEVSLDASNSYRRTRLRI